MRAQFIMVGKIGWQEYLPAVAAVARGSLLTSGWRER